MLSPVVHLEYDPSTTPKPSESESTTISLQAIPTSTPTSPLSFIDKLPEELKQLVLCFLDIESHFHYRHVNLRARVLATNYTPYRLVTSYALDAYELLLRFGLGAAYSLEYFYSSICIQQCTLCDKSATFLFIPTLERCCYDCRRHAAEYTIHMPRFLASKLHLRLSDAGNDLEPHPVLSTLPGMFSSVSIHPALPKRPIASVQAMKQIQDIMKGGADNKVTLIMGNIDSSGSFRLNISNGSGADSPGKTLNTTHP